MVRWAEVEAAAPDLAAAVAARFSANVHHVLGTVGPDGAPRLWGLEVPIRGGEVWLGMMPASAKRADLDRDPRMALHSAPLEADLAEGDAKVAGVAVDQGDDAAAFARFSAGLDQPMPPGGAAIFCVDVHRVTLTRVDGDVLRITTWTPRQGLAVHEVR